MKESQRGSFLGFIGAAPASSRTRKYCRASRRAPNIWFSSLGHKLSRRHRLQEYHTFTAALRSSCFIRILSFATSFTLATSSTQSLMLSVVAWPSK